MNTEITSSIHYVGVNDRHKHIFEGLWPLPYGVSYNSYIIDDEKVALIDTVEVDFFPQFLANIRSVIGDRPIDYIIVNHVEPDHSGSLPLIKKYYPEARIVGNKKTFDMVRGYYNVGTGDDIVEVSNGDTLQLGKHTLSFIMIPMVHWPETMATLDQTANVLFSGDAFGCFGALAGAFVDADMNCDIYWDEMRRYYSNIVGKYGVPVQQALKKLAGVKTIEAAKAKGAVVDTLKNSNFFLTPFIAATQAPEAKVAAALAATKANETSGVVLGTAGAYVLKVVSHDKGTGTFDKTTETNMLARQYVQIAQSAFLDLAHNAKIVDNRYKF